MLEKGAGGVAMRWWKLLIGLAIAAVGYVSNKWILIVAGVVLLVIFELAGTFLGFPGGDKL